MSENTPHLSEAVLAHARAVLTDELAQSNPAWYGAMKAPLDAALAASGQQLNPTPPLPTAQQWHDNRMGVVERSAVAGHSPHARRLDAERPHGDGEVADGVCAEVPGPGVVPRCEDAQAGRRADAQVEVRRRRRRRLRVQTRRGVGQPASARIPREQWEERP